MKVNQKSLPKSRIQLTISLDADEFQHHINHALDHISKDLKLAGFRKGKAPHAFVEKTVGKPAVIAEAVEHAIPDAYYQAVLENKIHPLESPHVHIESTENGFTFTAEVDVLPKIEVKDWRRVRANRVKPEALEKDAVDKVIESLRKERAELIEANRAVEKGDFAVISYSGSIDGVLQENMSSQNHPLLVGEGRLIPGFEDELEGMKAGDEKTFEIEFPKDYKEKTLAKKKATFTVKLESMKALKLPELDEAFAKQFDKNSVDELLQSVKEQLEEAAELEAKEKTQEGVLQELAKRVKADLPEAIIVGETDRVVDTYKKRLNMDDDKFVQFLHGQNKTLESFRKELREQAERSSLIGLALGEIMKDFEIEPDSDMAVQKTVDQLVEIATK